ncbi:MAG: aminotransferase class IV [Deltaproteobacteria bacterium]|nr:aminotransferase class IV [Deltaproteobacteria bacterium]
MTNNELPSWPHQQKYFSFYSSYFNQMTTDPKWMLVPLDDHGFHRGDGVFEAIKWKNNKIWLLEKHLDRLFQSAEKIFLRIPLLKQDLETKIRELVSLANKNTGMIRVYVTRGPGNFGVSPKETIGSQVYIVTTELKEVAQQLIDCGARAGWSLLPPKEGFWAQTKSLNYLPNVLMKKECEDQDFDFIFGVTENELISESYTENILCLMGDELFYPSFDYTLKGTTLSRLVELLECKEFSAQQLPIRQISSKRLTKDELFQSDAIFVVGTTLDIIWINSLHNKNFSVPNCFKELRKLILQDQM